MWHLRRGATTVSMTGRRLNGNRWADHEIGTKEPRMKNNNWIRLVLCGFVAGVVWHLLSVVFIALFAPDFMASLQRTAPHQALGGLFFYAVDLAMGVWAVWLYSAIAPTYGKGATAVVVVGIAWWILKTLQSAKLAGLGFIELSPALFPLGAATLAATVLAAVTGAWLYRKVSDVSPQDLPAT
jgi:hypothetical protein